MLKGIQKESQKHLYNNGFKGLLAQKGLGSPSPLALMAFIRFLLGNKQDMPRLSSLEKLLSPNQVQVIRKAKILLIGAGGIGCEILKNVVMLGFKEIHVVDLDTIDLSNLNRQFLFRKKDIGKSKAKVAKASASLFFPTEEGGPIIYAYLADIKDESKFTEEWFKSFNLALNALDNLDARRYVNQMCLLADIPLLESGTAGYLGQACVIKKDETECFDCQPKPTPKTFPVCTIRSTPSAPIHCVVWAKNYLFSQLFGRTSEEETVASTGEENENELEELRKEEKALKDLCTHMEQSDFSSRVFDKVFDNDIKRLLSMEDMWKKRTPPTPLTVAEVLQTEDSKEEQENINAICKKENEEWSIVENTRVFVHSISNLSIRRVTCQDGLEFDKDDEDCLNFVASASNLRASVFSIHQQTKFQVKAMAGNIIPAIGTTNAIVAGLVVMEALKVLDGRLGDCKNTFLVYGSRRTQILCHEPLASPNLQCFTCQPQRLKMYIDANRTSLSNFIDATVKHGLGIEEEFSITEGNRLIYDFDFEDNLASTLDQLGLTGKAICLAMENGQASNMMFIIIHHREGSEAVLEKNDNNKLIQNTAMKEGLLKRKAEEVPEVEVEVTKKSKVTIDENGCILLD